MRCGQQPVELAVRQADSQFNSGVERGTNPPDSSRRDFIEVAVLDCRDRCGRNSGASGDIRLAQATANAERAQCCADSLIVHGATIAAWTYRAVIPPLVGFIPWPTRGVELVV
jgi:hypothetical protein